MFILLGYLTLTLLQLYRQYRRRKQYADAMQRALRTGSVLVQRVQCTQYVNGGTPGLLSSNTNKRTRLLCDEHLALSAVSPKQKVDLGDWTSYFDHQPSQANGIIALLEAKKPDNFNSNSSLISAAQVSFANQVHVLKFGYPLAWKSGSPFGIVLLCTYHDFVLLCDAFGQGQLTLDDELELHHMLTVFTVGKPKSLQQQSANDAVAAISKGDQPSLQPAACSDAHTAEAGESERMLSEMVTSDVSKFKTEFFPKKAGKLNELNSPENGSVHQLLPESPVRNEGRTGEENSVHENDLASELCDEKVPVPNSAPENDIAFESSGEKVSVQNSAPENDIAFKSRDEKVPVQNSAPENDIAFESSDEKAHVQNSAPENDIALESCDQNISQVVSGMESASEIMEESITSELSAIAGEDISNGQNLLTLDSRSEATQQDGFIPVFNGFQRDGSVSEDSVGFEIKIEASPIIRPPSESLEAENSDQLLPSESTNGAIAKPHNLPPEPPVSIANGIPGHQHASQERSSKPPNVVVYCGVKDTARKFEIIKTGLEQCLNTDAYGIYLLHHDEIMSVPWEDNSAALVISHDYLIDNINRKCVDYLLKGGKVISFGSSIEAEFIVRKETGAKKSMITKFNLENFQNVCAIRGRYHYVCGSLKKRNSSMESLIVDPESGNPLVMRLTLSSENGNGMAIFSQLFLERDPSEMAVDSKTFSLLKQNNTDRLKVLRHLLSLLHLDTSVTKPPTLTPCYILAQDQVMKKSLLDSVSRRMKQDSIRSRNLTLKFISVRSKSPGLQASSDLLPVYTDEAPDSAEVKEDEPDFNYFEPAVYWGHLTTSVLGRIVFYTDVIPTTMTIFEGIQFSIPDKVGVVAVAGRQTSGKGRGGNSWLSPVGCAMFTLPLQMPLDSNLGHSISFLQHIIALAVVHSIRSIPGYQDLDLRLKWPNDIYYGNKLKLGGVLATSTVIDNTVHATVGCGVNVANSQPTVCINDVIKQHNHEHGLNLELLTTSEVIARTLSSLEVSLTQFQRQGHKDFCQLYYQYWLHSGTYVKVEREGNAEVQICGLDDFGYLRVMSKDGEKFSVQPDGNSFDMLRNLIIIKRD